MRIKCLSIDRSLFLVLLLLTCSFIAGAKTIKDTLVFAVITDTHIGKPGNSEGMARIIEDINKRPEISFVVNTGDVSDFGLMDQLEEAKELMGRLNKPYYIVPGNHDTGWSGGGGLAFAKVFNDEKFLEDIHGYRLIGISTGPYIRMSLGFVPAVQLEWLDSLIRKTPAGKPVLFFSHIPLIGENMSNYQEVIERLKKMNVVAAFCGHGHANKVFDYDGLPGVMTKTAQEREGMLAYNMIRLTKDTIEVKMIHPGVETDTVWAALPIDREKVVKKPVWTYQDSGNILSTPAVWDTCFFVGNLRGEFKSHSLNDGKVIWTYNTRQPIYSSPAVEGNNVVFGSADSSIYCLDVLNGKLRWKIPTGGSVVSSPLIDKGKVYIGSSDLYYRCIDLQTGRLIWKSEELAGFPPGKPTLSKGKIVFGTWNKTLYALNTASGSTAWTWENAAKTHYYSPAISTPVIIRNKVYTVAPDEMVHVFDLQTGKQVSAIKGHRVRESFGGDPGQNLLFAKTMQDTVTAWSVAGPKPRLTMSISGGFGTDISPSDIVIRDQTAYFGTTRGMVYAIDLEQKKVKWISEVSKGMVNTPLVLAGKLMLVTSNDGKISLFNTHSNNN